MPAARRLIPWAAACLAVLVTAGLVLTTLAQIREAAARSTCSNNLKQLGLALENYYSTYDRYPMATMHNPEYPPERRLSWLFEMDPFLEARMDPEWIKYRKEPWDSENNLRLGRQRMRVVSCPSFQGAPTRDGPALTSYVGPTGIGADAATLPIEDPRVGLFGYDRKTTKADVKDGASTTIAVIETASENGPWMAGGWPTTRPLMPEAGPPLGRGRPFGGIHSDRTLAAMIDGSVRGLTDRTDPDVLRAFFTIKAGDDPGPLDADR